MTLNVYLIPGMSAGRESFEALTLPDHCSATVIPWLLPKRKEPLIDYAKRMLVSIDTQAPFVLIGVSFGGIVAQEALNFLTPKALILISTVKSDLEKPAWMRWAYKAQVHKLLPYYIAGHLAHKPLHMLPDLWQKRWKQYDYYLPMRHPEYLSWGVDQVLKWKGPSGNVEVPLFHIHGDSDDLFPLKNIKDAQVISGGPHIMILTHAKAVSKLLARICQGL
jgi:pimeloyl-ACP methyl ester carboxylesterase